MLSGSFAPGDLAIWHSGSAMMSWPPDGYREALERLDSLNPKKNTIVFIVAHAQHHGVIVLADHRLWWCPISSLRGEPSGSLVLQY